MANSFETFEKQILIAQNPNNNNNKFADIIKEANSKPATETTVGKNKIFESLEPQKKAASPAHKQFESIEPAKTNNSSQKIDSSHESTRKQFQTRDKVQVKVVNYASEQFVKELQNPENTSIKVLGLPGNARVKVGIGENGQPILDIQVSQNRIDRFSYSPQLQSLDINGKQYELTLLELDCLRPGYDHSDAQAYSRAYGLERNMNQLQVLNWLGNLVKQRDPFLKKYETSLLSGLERTNYTNPYYSMALSDVLFARGILPYFEYIRNALQGRQLPQAALDPNSMQYLRNAVQESTRTVNIANAGMTNAYYNPNNKNNYRVGSPYRANTQTPADNMLRPQPAYFAFASEQGAIRQFQYGLIADNLPYLLQLAPALGIPKEPQAPKYKYDNSPYKDRSNFGNTNIQGRPIWKPTPAAPSSLWNPGYKNNRPSGNSTDYLY